jgi:hypothetical protein
MNAIAGASTTSRVAHRIAMGAMAPIYFLAKNQLAVSYVEHVFGFVNHAKSDRRAGGFGKVNLICRFGFRV